MYRVHLKTNDLVEHFKQLGPRMPSFEELENIASDMSQAHATTQAFTRARYPTYAHPPRAPPGRAWTHETAYNNRPKDSDIVMQDPSNVEELPVPPPPTDADLTLANSTLFIRNGIWWREVCSAVAEGDPGRVWEILKVYLSVKRIHFD